MKRLFFALMLCGAVFCLASCDKLGDDESDGIGSGGRPVTPVYKEYRIDSTIICRDSILYDNQELKQNIN
ncbi:hypothetical protein [Dysgonomonas sp. ZJ709]|uniref:hypothetical protein n=1 Tax=Dysgonomonas sp. ZJ709 TaxID=2709797 RepID=UPI0013ED0D85|nr:hypothetical protein [Dysgonomonas sp. ZJ709]